MRVPPPEPPNRGGKPPAKKYPPGSNDEGVILRVRMKRRLLNRIKAITQHDREVMQESWNLSDACREILLDWAARREAEIARTKAARFSGLHPDQTYTVLRNENARDAWGNAGEDNDDDADLALVAKN